MYKVRKVHGAHLYTCTPRHLDACTPTRVHANTLTHRIDRTHRPHHITHVRTSTYVHSHVRTLNGLLVMPSTQSFDSHTLPYKRQRRLGKSLDLVLKNAFLAESVWLRSRAEFFSKLILDACSFKLVSFGLQGRSDRLVFENTSVNQVVFFGSSL